MRTSWLWLTPLLAVAITPVAAHPSRQAAGEAELAKQLDGLVPGKPQDCVSLSRIDGSQIIEGTAVVYRGFGGTIYVNRPGGAERLHDDDIPVQYVYGAELCRLDQMRLLDRSTRMEHGFAILGQFVPYSKARKAD